MGNQLQDAKLAALEVQTAQVGDADDLERLWLLVLTGATSDNTTEDLWNLYLTLEGYTVGQLQDRQSAWLAGLGHVQKQINEQWLSFWEGGAVTGP